MIAFSKRGTSVISDASVLVSHSRNFKLTLAGFIFLVLGLLVWQPLTARAEGSGDLFRSGQGSRANAEWRNTYYGGTASTSGSVLRRTLLSVYANAGEYIMVGSSAMGQGFSATEQADIRIYNPGLVSGVVGHENVPATPSFSCLNQRAQPGLANIGVITRREQEVGGPETINLATGIPNVTDPINLYTPCYYKAPAKGIYNVVFLGPRGDNSDVDVPPSGSIADVPNNFNTTQETNVALWDVTVRPDATNPFTPKGRLFANYLTLYTGANPRPLFSTLYIVTTDGYIYQSNLNGLDPNGFVVSANQVGYYDSDGTTPLYHDVLAQFFDPADPTLTPNGRQRMNQLFQLQGGASLASPKYPIFFNPPDPQVLTALGIPLTPINPVVSVPVFTSNIGRGITLYGEGGNFFYNSNVGGVYQLIISRDGVNFDPTNPLNRVLRGARGPGNQAIVWDGRDNAGNLFPVGRDYRINFQINAGELHFPLLDAENSRLGGPSYRLLNPPLPNCPNLPFGCTTSFYDDRGYRTANGTVVGTLGVELCGANPPTIPYSIDGYDSTSAQRGYGYAANDPNLPGNGGNVGIVCTSPGGTGAFGDTKGLDLWTFFPSAKSTTVLEIVDQAPTPTPTPTATPTPSWSGVVITPTPGSLTPTPTPTISPTPDPTLTPDPGAGGSGSPPATAGSGSVAPTPTPLPGLPNTGRVPAEPDNWFGWVWLVSGLLFILAGGWLSFGRTGNRRGRR